MQRERDYRRHRRLMCLLRSKGMGEDARRDLVYHFTDGRTCSSSDLTDMEINVLCERLEADAEQKDKQALIDAIERKKKISAILSIATRSGIHDVRDWGHFNDFMLKRSVHKKPLYKYTLCELDELLGQFKKIERNFEKQSEKKGFKAFIIKSRLPDPSLN